MKNDSLRTVWFTSPSPPPTPLLFPSEALPFPRFSDEVTSFTRPVIFATSDDNVANRWESASTLASNDDFERSRPLPTSCLLLPSMTTLLLLLEDVLRLCRTAA
jgi:hypothetical protein